MWTERFITMGSKMYERGVRLEREVIHIFKEHGYEAVRTAGSHSPFDVILIKKNELNKICFVAFVQCKTTRENMQEQELAKLL